jgi:glycosyltransferase involved in cell wall biosynthesis
MKNILYIHQSAELYGSDKTLLYLVSEIKEKGFYPIVVLPFKGPLYTELEKHEIEIIIAPVLKISRKMFAAGNMLSMPFQIFKAFRIIRKQLNGRPIHLVHSNTLAVLTGALYGKFFRIKHLWHVHEIVEHPKFISELYPKIVDYFSDVVVFNSKATRDFMVGKKPGMAAKSKVVLNGFDRTEPVSSKAEITQLRKNLFNATPEDVVIALVGRISRWKGQQLLLGAFRKLERQNANVKLVFVGSAPPNQEIFLERLQEKINGYNLQDKVRIVPFRDDIWNIWDSIDIATVPSTEPEPFGLVAIEAMLASKPVIGANHGGLVEIIIEGETGLLVTPGDEEKLTHALSALTNDESLRTVMGTNGSQRAAAVFSLKRYVADFAQLYS